MMPAPLLVALTMLTAALLLGLRKARDVADAGESPIRGSGGGDDLRRLKLVSRIFSREDRRFVLLLGSPRLHRMYLEERRKVALYWVRGTSRDVHGIMRAHLLASRQSHDLHPGTELKLLLQYVRLQLLCSLLVLLIKTLGPHSLSDLALQAGDLQEQMYVLLSSGSSLNHVVSPEETGIR